MKETKATEKPTAINCVVATPRRVQRPPESEVHLRGGSLTCLFNPITPKKEKRRGKMLNNWTVTRKALDLLTKQR